MVTYKWRSAVEPKCIAPEITLHFKGYGRKKKGVSLIVKSCWVHGRWGNGVGRKQFLLAELTKRNLMVWVLKDEHHLDILFFLPCLPSPFLVKAVIQNCDLLRTPSKGQPCGNFFNPSRLSLPCNDHPTFGSCGKDDWLVTRASSSSCKHNYISQHALQQIWSCDWVQTIVCGK